MVEFAKHLRNEADWGRWHFGTIDRDSSNCAAALVFLNCDATQLLIGTQFWENPKLARLVLG